MVGTLDLDQLGSPGRLINALRDWSREREEALRQAEEMRWSSPIARREWSARGLTLAHDLQHEIGDRVDVFYSGEGPLDPTGQAAAGPLTSRSITRRQQQSDGWRHQPPGGAVGPVA